MRVRQILLLVILAAAILPSLFYGVWAYRETVRHDFADAEERHLLLARNLSATLSRYQQDLSAAIISVSNEINGDTGNVASYRELLRHLNIDTIAQKDNASGATTIKFSLSPAGSALPDGPEFDRFLRSAPPDAVQYSTVMATPDGQNVIYAALNRDAKTIVARLTTSYFVELGKSLAFGMSGHAAIVDQEGNVLAHPRADWVAQRRNIADIPAVARMLRGESGTERFHSPAMNAEMIAGLAPVAGSGWGVMVPQPVSELNAMVLDNVKPIFSAIAIRLAICLVFVWIVVKVLIVPIENLIRDIRRSTQTGSLRHIVPAPYAVGDVQDIASAYNRMIDRVEDSNAEITKLANTDTVTGLPNRNRFNELIADEMFSAAAGHTKGALALVDVDNFKDINDIHGHQKGDEVLCAVAEKLLRAARTSGAAMFSQVPFVCRIGGDEFGIVIAGSANRADLQSFLNATLSEIADIGAELELQTQCGASIGCARYPENGASVKQLMRNADVAMYQAKRNGRNIAQIYNPRIDSLTEIEIRSDFATAMSSNQLVVEYQPTVCTRRKVVAGAEALVRWQHPRLGHLAPSKWLPAISGSAMIHELGNWVFEQAITTQLDWRKRGHDLTIAVNISSEQFASNRFAEDMIAISKRVGADPRTIFIEVTEDALFSNERQAEATLRRLKKAGFLIAIDDFGKGYSNLARLAQLPIDFIKIDQSLICGAVDNPRVSTILDTTITMAKKLDCKIVAEGIESREFAEFATRNGANLLQGYFFAASMPSDQLIEWIDGSAEELLEQYRGSLQAA